LWTLMVICPMPWTAMPGWLVCCRTSSLIHAWISCMLGVSVIISFTVQMLICNCFGSYWTVPERNDDPRIDPPSKWLTQYWQLCWLWLHRLYEDKQNLSYVKSQTGVDIYISSCPIICQSKLQDAIAFLQWNLNTMPWSPVWRKFSRYNILLKWLARLLNSSKIFLPHQDKHFRRQHYYLKSGKDMLWNVIGSALIWSPTKLW
jgi:hypothetical protein